VTRPRVTPRVAPLEAYARWAATFDCEDSAIVALETRSLIPRMPQIAGKRFIDIGCGTGRWLRWSVERGARAAGVDLSLPMLREAERKSQVAGRVAHGDALRAPFPDGCADIVLSTLALGHIRPIEAAMEELARIAAPGATVLITDFHPDALRRGWKRTFQNRGETIEMESEPYSIAELHHRRLEMLEFHEAGFEEPERPIFEAADKSAMFEQVRGQTAIFLARFRRVG
jgi:ubiquinone/menaquinone biosynthesis C-methylase UbiE